MFILQPFSTRREPEPTYTDAGLDWQLLAAPRGGHWLCAPTAIGFVVLAAPGVPVSDTDDVPGRWRRARWLSADQGPQAIDLRPPDELSVLTLKDVAELAGPAWEPWLRRVMTILLERTYSYGFVGTADAPIREERAQATQPIFDTLASETRAVFPDIEAARLGLEAAPRLRRPPRTVRQLLRRARGQSRLRRLWLMLVGMITTPRDSERVPLTERPAPTRDESYSGYSSSR